jgi:hypothetical protein
MAEDKLIKEAFSVKKSRTDLIEIEFKAVVKPEETGRLAELVEDSIFEILNQDPNQTYNVLLDLTSVGGMHYLSPKAMEIYSRFPKLRQLKRSAVVGNNIALETFVNFVMQAAGKELTYRWCKNREEAIAWLNESQ